MLNYRLKIYSTEQHLFEVQLTWNCHSAGIQEVYMPSWTPGSYMIRDFARNVVKISAKQDCKNVTVIKKDKDSWQLDVSAGSVQLNYQVYARDASVRAAYLDGFRGFVNPTAVFICPQGLELQSCELEVQASAVQSDWKVATTMPVVEVDAKGCGAYRVNSFHDLIDFPLEFGNWRGLKFEVAGVPHEIVLSGIANVAFDEQRLINDVQKICKAHIHRFHGENKPPFSKYLFLLNVTKDGYGGLEHRDSTALVCSLRDLPAKVMPRATAEYRQLLGLFSHEYFHAWNVKRITPAKYQQPDYKCEVYTPLLWAFEGITSYFDDYTVLQAGCITVEEYLDTVAQTVSRVERGCGRHLQSVAESSYDAWTRFYKQDANSPNAIVSYYAKGALIALALDIWLIAETNSAVTLEKVMQQLWERFGCKDVGLEGRSIQQVLEELLLQNGFSEQNDRLQASLNDWVYGVADLPLEMLLSRLGVDLKTRPPFAVGDKGGKALHQSVQVSLAAEITADAQGLKLRTVYSNGTAESLGLMDGDIVVAINSIKADNAWLQTLQLSSEAADKVTVHYFRDGVLSQASGAWEAANEDRVSLTVANDVEPAVVALRKAWLGC